MWRIPHSGSHTPNSPDTQLSVQTFSQNGAYKIE
jgi:hypothetical protein